MAEHVGRIVSRSDSMILGAKIMLLWTIVHEDLLVHSLRRRQHYNRE